VVGAEDRGTCTGRCAHQLPSSPLSPASCARQSCWDADGPTDPRGFARADHFDHIYAGWDGWSAAS